jgi:uncharacterized protein YndB with AHSA1/START domain
MTSFAAPTTRTLVVERELPHPPEEVWRALTAGALLERWLMKNDFQPIVGHRFTFRADPMPHWNGVAECEVILVEPPERLSYSWNASVGAGGSAGDLKTVVNWTVRPAEGGVLVRMKQSGFRLGQEPSYESARHAWEKFLGGLERVAAEL